MATELEKKIEAREAFLRNQYHCHEVDHFGTSGVLLSNEIEYYAINHQMITPFEKKNLKAASYELTVGPNYSLEGKTGQLTREKNTIEILPFQVIVIETTEMINLPRFIIARWNIRVKFAYEGLLWVGGPQVDPGWIGNLPCPLYNLSNKPVTLHLGEEIAIMDFVKTTPFIPTKSVEYDRPPKRVLFEQYKTDLDSALYTEAKGRIDEIKDDVKNNLKEIHEKIGKYSERLDQFMGIVFSAIAILVAALAIFVSGQKEAPVSLPVWIYLFAAISLTALYYSISSYYKSKTIRSQLSDVTKVSQQIIRHHLVQDPDMNIDPPYEPKVIELFFSIASFLLLILTFSAFFANKIILSISGYLIIPIVASIIALTLGMIILNNNEQFIFQENNRIRLPILILQIISFSIGLISFGLLVLLSLPS